MLRKMIPLALCCLLLCGCSALPAEERSFAVALGVSGGEEGWTLHARIPSYQQSGEYLTVSARAGSITGALSALDASAPMRLHLGQVRAVVFSPDADIPAAVTALAQRPDMRLQAQLCVTEGDVKALMDGLKPAAGARLSKSLDVMMETRRDLGAIPDASLSRVLRMGDRQSPVLVAAELKEETLQLSGGWMADGELSLRGRLEEDETRLLALLQGKLRRGTVTLGEEAFVLSDVESRVGLHGRTGRCRISLRAEEDLSAALTRALQALGDKLSQNGCDALGLGGYAVRHTLDEEAWRSMDWPAIYQELVWDVRVMVEPPA